MHLTENVALHVCVDMHTCVCLTVSPEGVINTGANSNSFGWAQTEATSAVENS